uniref:Ig-like domain-containing protein n=1 Tax=Prolemur simus TaxID=1328070 RepID=A0A8C8YLS1_PROSS
MSSPSSAEGGHKRSPGAAQPHCGDQGLCPPWPGLRSSSCSSVTAQVGAGFRDLGKLPASFCLSWHRCLKNVTLVCPQHPGVSVFAGSLSQPVLTQPPSLSASPGASARLTCTLSSDISVGGYGTYWYQQKPGSPPRYLLYYSDPSKHQGSGVPSRFSGSKDASANAGILHISGLQPEDEADYY